MSDYISREALGIGFCNPDVFEDKGYATGWNAAIQIIKDAPAADVRPMVYCKECKHYVRGELFGDMVCDYHYRHHYHMEDNDYCSKGEKREEQDGN